jgi:hypothetical protein
LKRLGTIEGLIANIQKIRGCNQIVKIKALINLELTKMTLFWIDFKKILIKTK